MTKDELIAYLHDHIGLDTDEIDEKTPLFSSGLLDSFSMVDVMSFIEKRCGFKMRPLEVNLDNLDSVERMLAYARSKQELT